MCLEPVEDRFCGVVCQPVRVTASFTTKPDAVAAIQNDRFVNVYDGTAQDTRAASAQLLVRADVTSGSAVATRSRTMWTSVGLTVDSGIRQRPKRVAPEGDQPPGTGDSRSSRRQ